MYTLELYPEKQPDTRETCFAPRLKDAHSKKLYVAGSVGIVEPLNTVLFEHINTKLIMEQWDGREGMCRFVHSSRDGLHISNDAETSGVPTTKSGCQGTNGVEEAGANRIFVKEQMEGEEASQEAASSYGASEKS